MAINYVIHPIPLTKTEGIPKEMYTWLFNYGQTVSDAHFSWYLKGPRENIIVDTGMTAEKIISLGMKAEAIQTLDEGLEKLGIEVGDIDYIILTHSHYDHITSVRRFPKAKVIIQSAELEFVRNPHPFFKAWRPKDLTELLDGVNFEVVKGDTKIDEGIQLLLTQGHTPGGQSVAVKTTQGTAIITGWCSIQENFNPPPEIKEMGFSFMLSGIHTDPIQAYESMERIISLADIIVPNHEVGMINRLTIP